MDTKDKTPELVVDIDNSKGKGHEANKKCKDGSDNGKDGSRDNSIRNSSATDSNGYASSGGNGSVEMGAGNGVDRDELQKECQKEGKNGSRKDDGGVCGEDNSGTGKNDRDEHIGCSGGRDSCIYCSCRSNVIGQPKGVSPRDHVSRDDGSGDLEHQDGDEKMMGEVASHWHYGRDSEAENNMVAIDRNYCDGGEEKHR